MDLSLAAREYSAELIEVLLEDQGITGALTSVACLAAEHLSIDRPILCGIIIERPKKNILVASSSTETRQMDEAQVGLDEGPCLEAQRSDTIIRVFDVRYEKRWPRYMAQVRRHGLRSVLAVPLSVDAAATAAMSFYTHEAAVFTAEDAGAAKRYAEMASSVVAIALHIAAHAETAEHRRIAMESRTAIDLAAGVVMGQNRCSQDEAMTILKSASNHRNIKLRTLAEQIVAAVGHGPAFTSFES